MIIENLSPSAYQKRKKEKEEEQTPIIFEHGATLVSKSNQPIRSNECILK